MQTTGIDIDVLVIITKTDVPVVTTVIATIVETIDVIFVTIIVIVIGSIIITSPYRHPIIVSMLQQ